MKIVVSSRQSLIDVAVQHGGDFGVAFDMAEANGLSLTDDVEAGEKLALPNVQNAKVVQYYTTNGICPATSITQDEINAILAIGEGIGYWEIGYDFIIQ